MAELAGWALPSALQPLWGVARCISLAEPRSCGDTLGAGKLQNVAPET